MSNLEIKDHQMEMAIKLLVDLLLMKFLSFLMTKVIK